LPGSIEKPIVVATTSFRAVHYRSAPIFLDCPVIPIRFGISRLALGTFYSTIQRPGDPGEPHLSKHCCDPQSIVSGARHAPPRFERRNTI
jgi:hypothetical protein